MQTVKEQIKGIRKGAAYEGWGAFCGRTVQLVDRNLNGHAAFQPMFGSSDYIFVSHDNTMQLVRS